MRSVLIVFLILLLGGLAAWILLSDGQPAPPLTDESQSSSQAGEADSPTRTDKETSAVLREVQAPTTTLLSSALPAGSEQANFLVAVRRGVDRTPIANAIVAIYSLKDLHPQLWRREIWGEAEQSDATMTPLYLLQSDEQGHIRLPLPQEQYGITGKAEGFFGLTTLASQQAGATHELLLWTDRSFEIAVVDPNGNALEGIPVGPLQSGIDGVRFLSTKKTDVNGIASFPHLGARIHDLRSVPFLTAAPNLPWNIQVPTPVPFPDLPERIVLTSPAVASLHVKLVDSKGDAYLEPCKVSLSVLTPRRDQVFDGPIPPEFFSYHAQESDNGETVFENVGLDLGLSVRSDFGLADISIKEVVRGPRESGKATTVILQQQSAAATFPLRILDVDGAPLADANLEFTYSCRGEPKIHGGSRQQMRTDSEGHVSWGFGDIGLNNDGKNLSVREVKITYAGPRTTSEATFTLDLLHDFPEGLQQPQDIQLQSSEAVTFGMVLNPKGLPVADARVQYYVMPPSDSMFGGGWWTEGSPVYTDAEGKFQVFQAAYDHETKLTASHPDYLEASVALNGNAQEEVVLQLVDGYFIAGRVLLDEHIPTHVIGVEFHGTTDEGKAFNSKAWLKEDGSFSFPTDNTRPMTMKLFPGRQPYQFLWQQENLIPLPKDELAGQPYAEIDLRGKIHEYGLVVSSADGSPLGKVNVYSHSDTDRRIHLGPCHFGGFTAIGNGDPIEVEISAPSFQSVTTELKADEVIEVVLGSGIEVTFMLNPLPTLPKGYDLKLTLNDAETRKTATLSKDVFAADGTLTTMVSTAGSFIPHLSLRFRKGNSSMTTYFSGMDQIWAETQFSLTEGVPSATIQIPIDPDILAETLQRLESLPPRF